MATRKQERMERIMLEHVRGDTVRAIAEREHVTHQRIHQIVHRAKRLHVDSIELNLLVARKEGNVLVLVIPPALDDDQMASIHYLDFVLRELAARDIKTKLH